MEVAPRNTLLTMLILFICFSNCFTLLKKQNVCLYTLLGKVEQYWNGLLCNEQNVGWTC